MRGPDGEESGMVVYERQCSLPVAARDAFEWHARAGSFERLRPSWQKLRLIERTPGIRDGQRLVLHVRVGLVWRRWVAVHRDTVPGRRFADEQREGPFRRWLHTHRFLDDENGSRLVDRVEYELPLGAAGRLVGGRTVDQTLADLFSFRHRRTQDDLMRHAQYADRPRLRVAISGASGMIGSELTAFLRSGGHEVIHLVRRRPRARDEIGWAPNEGKGPAPADLEGVDAVVNLSGANLAALWTPAHKQAIYESRVNSTGLLATALSALADPPRVLISASASGYYGDRGEAKLDESAAPGVGFLPEVCRAWERAADPAADAGIRTVWTRSSPVLSGRGGMLPLMLLAFRQALGGPIGGGRQWVSWISLEDWLGAVLHLLYDDSLSGPVNVTSPRPVRNAELVERIGDVLRRPEKIPLPAAAVKLLFGEMGEASLLASTRTEPKALTNGGFRFLYPDLTAALRVELGRIES